MAVNDSVDVPDDLFLIRSSSETDLDDEKGPQEPEVSNFRKLLKRSGRLFAVKPVMILYGLSYSVTGSVTTQLWLDRVCRVNLGFNTSICDNLNSDPKYSDYQNQVQQAVAQYNIVGSYIENVPTIIMSLYLGPWSDRGRKPVMLLPFLGHVISGIFYFAFLYFKSWPAQLLWVTNVYVLFGGYTLLQIAMYGYIGDVTNSRERTTIMAILNGLGFIMFPLAEFASGQIYQVGGYYAVYATSLGATLAGIFYIFFIPESVTQRTNVTESDTLSRLGIFGKIRAFIRTGNEVLIKAVKCFFKVRPNKTRRFIFALVGITLISGLSRPWNSLLLFVEKMFGWTLVDYTNFVSFAISMYVIRMFITTPILCYWLGVHDCMLAITGGLASVAMDVTYALATKGWMMYYAVSITIFAGIQGTPITSLLSKCVETSEFGQIFTVSMVFSGIADLATGSLMQLVYAQTVDSAPGTVFFISTGFEVFALTCVATLYFFIHRHEKQFGELGKEHDRDL